MKQPIVTKIHYDWHFTKGGEKFHVAEVGKNSVVNIGLHENCSRATVYYEDGNIFITNNVNAVFAKAAKESPAPMAIYE